MADNEKYACGYKNSQTGEIVYYKDKDARSQLKEIEYSKADKNEVFTMANMGQDIKEAMTGGSVAVVGKNTILTDNIVDEQVTPYKTNFAKYGNNILNIDELVGGYVYSNGEIKNGDYVTTTYIPFSKGDKINLSRMDNPTQNTNITRRAIRTACFYDSSYNVLTDYYYDNGALTKESITYQGEGNVAYIRVSFQKILVDNAMLYLGEERTEYEKNGVIINKLKLNENLKEEIETKIKIDNNVLKDKTIINFGDSIGAGDGNNGVGYAELLAKKNDMTCYDYAVGGATITTSTNDILTQIEKAKNDKKTADYILFDGFTNDINNGAVKELGKISDGYSQTKDINTFSGAFEEICFRLKSYWKGIPIFYVCVHKMSSRDTELQNTYSTRAKTLCERWSIPVIDIYNEGGLNTYITDYKTLYTNNADGTHPNELGYNTFYVPLIEKNLKGGITSSANIKADNIKIEDVNNNFTSTNVEGALEEVSAQFKDIANNQPTDLSLDSATNLLQLVNSKGSKLGNGITLPISSGGGTSQYLHIKYSSTGAPQLAGQISDTPNAYIGLCVDTNADSPTNPRSYTWYQWKGDNGDTGATPNLQIGTVTTLDSGINATASITGTTENPLLNLGIPKGENGTGGSSDTLVTTNISGTTLSLTTDKYQTATVVDGTEITLPTVTSFTEIHLFFGTTTDLTLILPSCKWQNGNTPTISANKTYEFIFTYTTEWLGGVIEYVA